ncbi:MAG: 3'(2'),5'-bisphosphate nucleotidase CysQ [Alphaproteobacteria bacterium]|nr:3'(2'),5'-bisphosphate nucleotidase CysQ [Alphaproteobacteria bacterium]MCZ6764198.1 3'(2'),5'-bisphosphate nucleotidase CysQ [Alphaproteobacteria bacterium]
MPAQLLGDVKDIARRAGEVIADIYRRDFSVEIKQDGSPVTEADLAANAVIVEGLAELTPDIDIVSEEGSRPAPGSDGRRFWLVDPLDGTKDFVKKNDEFCVLIALIEDRYPTLGVIHAPATGRTYAGTGPGTATVEEADGSQHPIRARASGAGGLVQAVSRSRPDECNVADIVPGVTVADRIVSGSALKFALVAEGKADVYANLGGSCEWDTAAGQAVIEAAGGAVTVATGARLEYGKSTKLNPTFVAVGAEATWLPAGGWDGRARASRG